MHLLAGALHGLVLWLLYEALQKSTWPATSPPALGAACYAAAAVPLAWYLTHGAFASERIRLAFALVLGVCFAALGAHLGAIATLGDRPSWSPTHVLAAGVVGFAVVCLASGCDVARRRFDYPRLFEISWRNVVLAGVAGALTGALWVVLFAGAWLMKSIGVERLLAIYKEPAFAIPVTAAALGLAFGLAAARAQMLITLRHLVLSLAMWFLPLALAFAVAWVLALPFTGVQKLFDTGAAAFYLLWFGTLAIVFVNAAFQDGRDAPGYPRWLATAMQWAWLAVLPLTLLAGWALWQRIAQHGWTVDRIWAAVVWALIAMHALGYAASVVRRRGWMRTVPSTNIAATLVEIILIVALISPLADVQRLTVASQVARLQAGIVAPAQFDWNLLARETGAYGIAALKALAASSGQDESSKLVAKRAADTLRTGGAPKPAQDTAVALKALHERIAILPRGATPDRALLEWLARAGADWDERRCLAAPEACALWLIDLDRDGTPEAVLLWETQGFTRALLYSQTTEGWRKQGSLQASPRRLSVWLNDIESGLITLAQPKWADLMIGKERVRVGP